MSLSFCLNARGAGGAGMRYRADSGGRSGPQITSLSTSFRPHDDSLPAPLVITFATVSHITGYRCMAAYGPTSVESRR